MPDSIWVARRLRIILLSTVALAIPRTETSAFDNSDMLIGHFKDSTFTIGSATTWVLVDSVTFYDSSAESALVACQVDSLRYVLPDVALGTGPFANPGPLGIVVPDFSGIYYMAFADSTSVQVALSQLTDAPFVLSISVPPADSAFLATSDDYWNDQWNLAPSVAYPLAGC